MIQSASIWPVVLLLSLALPYATAAADCIDLDGDGFCLGLDCDDSTIDVGDGDGDGVPDGCDNCPAAFNPNQVDQDGLGPPQVFDQSGGPFRALALGDLDDDGDLDVGTGDRVEALRHENDGGRGDFLPEQVLESNPAFHDLPTAESGDVDGDGDTDLFVVHGWWLSADGASRVRWFRNDGTTLTSGGGVLAEGFYSGATLTDFDGDSDRDVIVSAGISGQIELFENDGAGNFGAPWLQTPGIAGKLLAGDLDGDDDEDLVIATTDRIYWLENLDGAGNFGSATTIYSGIGSLKSITREDLDGDGDLDLATASSGDGTIAWYENDGTGSFLRRVVASDLTFPLDVVAADIDADGDQDLLGADDNAIEWFENLDGSGTFGSAAQVGQAPGSISVIRAGDLDGDDAMDVVTGGGGTLAWYRNLHDGFGEKCDNCPDSFNAGQADFDSDGFGDACDVCPAIGDADQSDTDGDGAGDLCDCEPANPSARPSEEIDGVRFSRSAGQYELDWETAAGADEYNIIRGTVDGLRAGDLGSCIVTGVPGLDWTEVETPSVGTTYTYLVQGVSVSCGPGTVGYARAPLTCP